MQRRVCCGVLGVLIMTGMAAPDRGDTWGDLAIPVKVGIFHDCSGFAVMEACRGPHHRRGESQERAC
jgi:hypothetical protein